MNGQVEAMNGSSSSQIAKAMFSLDSINPVDISNQQLTLISPKQQSSIYGGAVTFWWESLNGATSYDFGIKRLDAANGQIDGRDISITTNQFALALDPGNYEWFVRAKNERFETSLQTFNFELDDITEAEVVLSSPNDNATSIIGSINFVWQPVKGASDYKVIIKYRSMD